MDQRTTIKRRKKKNEISESYRDCFCASAREWRRLSSSSVHILIENNKKICHPGNGNPAATTFMTSSSAHPLNYQTGTGKETRFAIHKAKGSNQVVCLTYFAQFIGSQTGQMYNFNAAVVCISVLLDLVGQQQQTRKGRSVDASYVFEMFMTFKRKRFPTSFATKRLIYSAQCHSRTAIDEKVLRSCGTLFAFSLFFLLFSLSFSFLLSLLCLVLRVGLYIVRAISSNSPVLIFFLYFIPS